MVIALSLVDFQFLNASLIVINMIKTNCNYEYHHYIEIKYICIQSNTDYTLILVT